MSALADDGRAAEPFLCGVHGAAGRAAGVETVRKGLNVAGTELMALRAAPRRRTIPARSFEARAAAPMVAQVLGPCIERRAASNFLQPL